MRRLRYRPALLTVPIVLFRVTTVGAQAVPTAMQRVDDYLMDEVYEVALARSAAPAKVSDDADVLVLRRGGYEQTHTGSNGFVCLVERSWSSPIGIHGDFFNPRLRAPICYNAEAARTTLRDYLLRTQLALEGKTISEIKDAVDRAIASGTLRAPSGPAMSYMMSSGQLLGTTTGQFLPHVMFYIPYATNQNVGHVQGTDCHVCMFEHAGGPFAAIVVPVPEFLDAPEPPSGPESMDRP